MSKSKEISKYESQIFDQTLQIRSLQSQNQQLNTKLENLRAFSTA